jgi:DNA-binding PadR family transcriptional regulator
MTAPAKTRIDLLILGLLLDQPVHGYDLYQKIQAESIDEWFNVSMAGVYYSLGKLHDQGLVIESRQRGGRSARKSIYRLTEKGRAAFFAAMEAQATSQDRTCLDFDLVIYLLNKLPLQRAVSLLEQRQAFLTEQARRVQAAWTAERDKGDSPLKIAILDHSRRFLEMERNWLAKVMRDVQLEGETGYTLAEMGTRRGLMVLSGDLRQYHVPDLLRFIACGQHSGTLTITDGALIRTLGFKEGKLVCAACLRRGESPPPPRPGKEILDRVCELFRWQEGQFTFDQTTCSQEWCVPVEISVEDLILRGCRSVEDWAIIQRLVPSSDSVFELDPTSRRLTELNFTPTEEQILAAIDGVQNIASIARQLGLTVFKASRTFYCLTAAGVVCTADPDKIRLRRLFREIAELMCNSTLAWRAAPDDRTCEKEVNKLCASLPIRLNRGRIEDQTDPQLKTGELVEMYRLFLQKQFEVVSRRFGGENARQSFERTLRRLAPELQDTAKHYGLDRLR